MAVQMLDKVLVMKPRRSHLVKSTPVETAIDTSIDNVYGEPQPDRFDEIIDLLKQDSDFEKFCATKLSAIDRRLIGVKKPIKTKRKKTVQKTLEDW